MRVVNAEGLAGFGINPLSLKSVFEETTGLRGKSALHC